MNLMVHVEAEPVRRTSCNIRCPGFLALSGNSNKVMLAVSMVTEPGCASKVADIDLDKSAARRLAWALLAASEET